MKRLFIVSNRLPINIQEINKTVEVHQSNGGLVTALSSYLFDEGSKQKVMFDEVLWAGAPGCSPATWSRAEQQVKNKSYEYLPVFISKRCYEAYYNGQSNSVIWPLFHYFPSFAEFDGDFYDGYVEANQTFKETLLPHLRPGDTIWIHDYHLMPLAGMIREEMPTVTIGFFLHIPFPSYELFRIMPKKWQEGIMHGLLSADLIGFHTIDYAGHFLKCAQMIFGLDDDMHLLQYNGRLVKVDVFPISIDYQKFYDAYDDTEVALARSQFLEQFQHKKIIFSADRLDYTKGVSSRLKAYEHFLLTNPEYQGHVVFVLVVVPSRDSISRYAKRKKMIDEYIGDINSRIGSIHWQPVIYQYANLEFTELVAMYTSCDLALITPLRDGMNLVSKEFIASRKDKKGVLVLSEMAGAAKELTEALIINPNDHEDIGRNIKQGLEMSPAEQERRILAMQKTIRNYNVKTWAADFMKQLANIKTKQANYEVRFLDHHSKIELLDSYMKSSRRLILLDYDGTLVPFSPVPAEAAPGNDLLEILGAIAEDTANDVYIISGRDSGTLESWLGHLPLSIVAEHGAKTKRRGLAWKTLLNGDQDWRTEVKQIMTGYSQRCANSFVETKEYSVAWHYRNANVHQAKLRSSELYSELLDLIKNHDLHILKGNKVIEVRNQGVDKGSAVQRILVKGQYDFIAAFGDDTTDEDMFRILTDRKEAYTLKVGDQASYAKYNLHTSYMVVSLLELMSRCATGQILEA